MKKRNGIVVCSRCLMDNTIVDFKQTPTGCNYCDEFVLRIDEFSDVENEKFSFNELVSKIKASGGSDYDCIVGVSGGVDSSWVLVNAVQHGLRVLAVHMDNGWNSELSQSNIFNLINSLGVDLETYVINWEEYRNMMQAFFNADVLDVELLYDNAMLAVNYQFARKHGVKFILSGDNLRTEGFRFPVGWNWLKLDKRNIVAINKKFGVGRIRSFPLFGVFDYFIDRYLFKIKWVPVLDYLDFNKSLALIELESKYGYKRYPYKHYESIFTRFYQGYILPEKFNVDKRKLHLSALVVNGEMSREDGLNLLNKIPFESEESFMKDKQYFLNKMQWTEQDLEDYIGRPEIGHDRYASIIRCWKLLKKIHQFVFNKTKFE